MSISFAVPVLGNYSKMATALGFAVKHYHPEASLLALTLGPASREVRDMVEHVGYDDLLEYRECGLDGAGYTSVIWTKFEAMALPTDDVIVILDADLIMYSRIDHLVLRYLESGKKWTAIRDINPDLGSNFVPDAPHVEGFRASPAVSACLLMFKRDPELRDELFSLARDLDGYTHWPEQGVLSLYAAKNGGFLDFGESAVIQCRDGGVLESPVPAPFIHVGAPRPVAFGANPVRWDEKTYEEECRIFQETFGVPFPEKRLVADFEARLYNRIES